MKIIFLLIVFLTLSQQTNAFVVSDVGARMRIKREIECKNAPSNSEKDKDCKIEMALENDQTYKRLNKQYLDLIKENLILDLHEQNKIEYQKLKNNNKQKQKELLKKIEDYKTNFQNNYKNHYYCIEGTEAIYD